MKRLIVLGVAVLLGVQLKAQSIKTSDVPTAVASSLELLYPEASKVNWEMEDGFYLASFMLKKMEAEALFSRDGSRLKSEENIDIATLPGEVKNALSYTNPSGKVEEASKLTDVYGKVTYEVEVDDMEYLFDAKGKLISKEATDDDDDTEDDNDNK